MKGGSQVLLKSLRSNGEMQHESCHAFSFDFWEMASSQVDSDTDAPTSLTVEALDPSKDPCLKVKCSPHKVCVTQDYQTALCVSRKHLLPRQKKGTVVHKHWVGPSNLVKCKPCPAAQSAMVCGSDGHTYTSKCKLEFHACSTGRSLTTLCDGPCPCLPEPEPPKHKAEKNDHIGRKRVLAPASHRSVSIHSVRKLGFSREKASLLSSDGGAQRMQSVTDTMALSDEISPRVPPPNLKRSDFMISEEGAERIFHDTNERGVIGLEHSVHEACTDKELRNLASRLKDWFGALHEDANRVIKPTSSETAQGRFDTSILPICKDSLGWMFNKLDMNYDLLLDHSEINAIYLDKYEPCIKPLFNSCDSFKDGKLSNNEWCYCFQKPGGAFIPRCNEEGYYKATQCHGSTGQCWCVDKYGNELAGSRKQGAVNCEEEQETSGDFGSGGSVVLLDDLEDEQELGPKDRLGKPRVHARAVTEDDEDEDDDKEDEVGYIWSPLYIDKVSIKILIEKYSTVIIIPLLETVMVDSVPHPLPSNPHPIPTSPVCPVNGMDPNLQPQVVPTGPAPCALLPV
ncbi:hypothetical protein MG293_008357 [Ovis ammon polii]|uniref:SPARC (osteonectin), cwcv and kazal like domains proteoglycan 1 n=1 Tax=Ovis ammon polii TaxID=230172 RepID=A0AAD4UBN2_OVIAM|nr:hypothetical protein MG293_008357 [Ovis ammon polii]